MAGHDLLHHALYSVGLEFEILIKTQDAYVDDNDRKSIKTFSDKFARNHNSWVEKSGTSHKHVKDHVNGHHIHDYSHWSLETDESMTVRYSMPWHFMQLRYLVSGNDECSTHVHVSMQQSYEFDGLKRVAKAILHFEPAFEALLSDSRRGHAWCRSNCPAYSPRLMADLMITSSADALKWAELASRFIFVAYHAHDDHDIFRHPPNLGGLRSFLNPKELPKGPGKFQDQFLAAFFDDADMDARKTPRSWEREDYMQSLLLEDARYCR
ncbi:MAG: hypothetical protein Q9162_003243 [Coniocarpon cinnabarinum]